MLYHCYRNRCTIVTENDVSLLLILMYSILPKMMYFSLPITAGSIAGTDKGLEYAKNYTVYTKVYGATVFPNSAELIISGNRNGCNNWIKEAGKPTMIEQGSI